MKPCHGHFVPFQCRIGQMLLLLTFISCQALAQPSSIKSAGGTDTGKAAPEMRAVELSVDLDSDHTVEIALGFESRMERQFNFPQLLSIWLHIRPRCTYGRSSGISIAAAGWGDLLVSSSLPPFVGGNETCYLVCVSALSYLDCIIWRIVLVGLG